ncbi:DNA-directed RNA polymerase III subunit RPC10 [Pseudolycoriella hygida]|uniref:DNA-directed RNA polymerase subunit n=1 Tax=Pseudolycoriella hygida TaxID=35572 RepID=A0A9Q0RZ43_9DIPT|nr:DNA-directed RNA polymerase III subunit RPC10 [Pseudolycoriella hygida]
MLSFCPSCSNLLVLKDGATSLVLCCTTCPYISNIKRAMTNRVYPKLKEIDKLILGSAALHSGDTTDAVCPKCSHDRAFYVQLQIRSADEPMTTFFQCCNNKCNFKWKD